MTNYTRSCLARGSIFRRPAEMFHVEQEDATMEISNAAAAARVAGWVIALIGLCLGVVGLVGFAGPLGLSVALLFSAIALVVVLLTEKKHG